VTSLVSAAVHPDTAFSASRRPLVRLLGIAPAVLLVSGLLTVWSGPFAGPVAAASGDWPQFQGGPTHIGYNATETTLSASNVAGLGVAWTGAGGSTPVVADGVVYVVGTDGYLNAYAVGCREDGGLCSRLWSGYVDSPPYLAPAVADGVVYYAGPNGNVYAFAVGCRSDGGTCSPLWTAATGDYIGSPVTVADGVVYVGSEGDKLYAFDATGVTHCSGSPKTCTPLWTGATGGQINAAPAVADGVVYIGASDGTLYAFPVGCRSDGGSCTPTWRGTAGSIWSSSPAVANGVVYVGSTDDKLYAFQIGCNSGGGTCAPLWSGATGNYIYSSPAVANGVVYVGSDDWNLYAFEVGCNSGGGTCAPLWKGHTGGMVDGSPAVANGVVYVGSNGDLKAYAVGCRSDGGYCTSIWTAPAVGASAFGSLALANGVVYVSCTVGIRDLYAFSLSPTTYHPMTPVRVLDTRNGTGGLSGPFTNHVARTFTVTGGSSGVPSNATAVTGNLTVTGQTSSGYLFIGPVATNNPGSSTLNFPVGDDRANAVTVALGAGGSLSITFVAPSNGPSVNAIFDVTGYFTPDTSGATFHALSPARVLDTRNGTGGLAGPFTNHAARTFQVTGGSSGVPAGATAVTGNLTVTGQTSSGYLYIGPVATNNPGSSTLNFPIGDDRANAVTVALGAGGTLSITFVAPSNGPTANAIFDVTGYFTADMSGATYVPLTPTRTLDTRNGTGGLSGPFTNHAARTFTVSGVPTGATAVTGNLTVTGQTSSGYLFVGPVATNNPGSSTLNFPVGDDRANAVTVALGGGGTLSITFVAPSNGASAQAIFDVTGYFVAAGG